MTTATSSGIPTVYRNGTFRSRLEARWAVFFDLVGWSWVYEPFDTGDWIPDFAITGANGVNGEAPFLIEIGPCVTEAQYVDKAAKPLEAFPRRSQVAGDGTEYAAPAEWTTLVLGIAPHALDGDRAGYATDSNWSEGPGWLRWTPCRVCGEMAVSRTGGFESYQHLPCGHHDDPILANGRSLADLWARAGDTTQWRHRVAR